MTNNSFPLIADLPELLVASDWRWEPCEFRRHCVIGIDPESRRWLVQIRGSQKAYQEHVFARLAQRLGISCQSSVLLQIPSSNFPLLNDTRNREASQLAIWLMDEHESGYCANTCPFKDRLTKSIVDEDDLVQWLNSGLPHVEDLVNAEVLGCICGGTEIPDRFWTTDHQYVAIDNERMFECEPYLPCCQWMEFPTGRKLAQKVLVGLKAMSAQEMCTIAQIPCNYVLDEPLLLEGRLRQIKALATSGYFELHADPEKLSR